MRLKFFILFYFFFLPELYFLGCGHLFGDRGGGSGLDDDHYYPMIYRRFID